VPDFCDVCPLDNPDDTDGDGVCDSDDACPLDNPDDTDGDTVCDSADVCAGFDDRVDPDGDGVPSGCDACPADNPDDSDGDSVCDSVDLCAGFDDRIDPDGDGVPSGCDPCPADNPDDTDGDTVCDSVDVCAGFDDRIDPDGDGVPSGCDACPADNPDDSDGDSVCDSVDACPGFDDAADGDGDGVADGCDPCPLDNPDDVDGDTLCASEEADLGTDPLLADTDGDGLRDDREIELGSDPTLVDSDEDGVDDGIEVIRWGSDPTDPTQASVQPDRVYDDPTAGVGAGFAISMLSDLNGDGLDEIAVGTPAFDPPAGVDAGRLQVLWGSGSAAPVDLSAPLDDASGLALFGLEGGWDLDAEVCARGPAPETCVTAPPWSTDVRRGWFSGLAGDGLGGSISRIGDFDGDGVGDFAVSSPWARVDGNVWGGRVYLVSGATAGADSLTRIEAGEPGAGRLLIGITGARGVGTIDVDPSTDDNYNGDLAGFAVTGGFDINGDGLSDVAVYAPGHGQDPELSMITVVFGSDVSTPLALADVNDGTHGIRITGYDEPIFNINDVGWTYHLSAAGDTDGDGYGDLLLHAPNILMTWGRPISHVIRGGAALRNVNLDTATAATVSRIQFPGDIGLYLPFGRVGVIEVTSGGPIYGGLPAGAGGDVNGDGLNDFVFTSWKVGNVNDAVVVFGVRDAAPSPTRRIRNTGEGGIVIALNQPLSVLTTRKFADLRRAATIVRDMNGDGYDEIVLGWSEADTGALVDNGRVHVVFGRPDAGVISLADIESGRGGFVVDGAASGASLGYAVAGSGDVDGDGLADLLLGAPDVASADPTGGVWLIRGDDYTGSIGRRGGDASDTFVGTSAIDRFVGGRGDDDLDGQGGADVLYGGAGNDRLVVHDATLRRAHGGGGVDRLVLGGAPWTLSPTTLRNRVFEIEAIDLSEPGAHGVSLGVQDVLEMQELGNEITVYGAAEDTVVLYGGGWVAGGAADGFVPWTNGLATVRAQVGVAVQRGVAFVEDPKVVDLPELSPVGTSLGTVAVRGGAVDTWELVSDPIGGFTMDAAGEIFVADTAALDFETNPEFVPLVVRATNADGVSTEGRVYVFIQDENEPPVWEPQVTLAIAEGVSAGASAGRIAPALDPDTAAPAEDRVVTYAIVGGDPLGAWTIDASTGELTVADAAQIDFERTPRWDLVVEASDALGAASTTDVVVEVLDVPVISQPLSLRFGVNGAPMWASEPNYFDVETLQGTWDNNPGGAASSELTVSPPALPLMPNWSVTTRASGRVLADLSVATTEGEVDVSFPVATELTFTDAVAPGGTFELGSTLDLGPADLTVRSPSWAIRFGMRFIDFEVFQFNVCAEVLSVEYCSNFSRGFALNESFTQDRANPVQRWTSRVAPSGGGYTTTFDRTWPAIDYEMSWVSYLNLALRRLGLPTNVGSFEFYPAGRVNGGFRYDYTVVEPIVRLAMDLDYRFGFSLSSVPVRVVFEDGTVVPGQLGTPLTATIPASRDANGDGTVDFVVHIEPQPTWTTRSTHVQSFAAIFRALNVRASRIDYWGDVTARYPPVLANEYDASLSVPAATFEEAYTMTGLNRVQVAGAIRLTP